MRAARRFGLVLAALLAVGAGGTALAAPASAATSSLVFVYVNATLTCPSGSPSISPSGTTASFATLLSTSTSGRSMTRKYMIQLDTARGSSQLATFAGKCFAFNGSLISTASGSVRVYTSPLGKTYSTVLT